MKFLILCAGYFCLATLNSCTQCTNCEYYYILNSTFDTISGGQDFCGSNKTVKDFEEYYKEQIEFESGLAGSIPVITCLRTRKQ